MTGRVFAAILAVHLALLGVALFEWNTIGIGGVASSGIWFLLYVEESTRHARLNSFFSDIEEAGGMEILEEHGVVVRYSVTKTGR